MSNKKLIEKLQEDMEMRSFSHYTKGSYLRKAKEVVLDKTINYKQLPMYKKKRRLPKILSEKELEFLLSI